MALGGRVRLGIVPAAAWQCAYATGIVPTGGRYEDVEDNQSHSSIARASIGGRQAVDLMAVSILRSAVYRSNPATEAS